MAMYTSDVVYEGDETIVVSMDIGTTHSGLILLRGGGSNNSQAPLRSPTCIPVTNLTFDLFLNGQVKRTPLIPTILAYRNGEIKLCGAEAIEYLDDDDYEIARWFKLHLHPESMKISDQPPAYASRGEQPPAFEIPELPQGVTLEEVYVEFIRYLYVTTRNYFVKGTPNGSNIWDRLADKIVIVLCTPNGWDMSQYSFLRKAAIKSGLVRESDADARLEFITEGEASVHYALAHTKGLSWLQPGTVFVVTDAGGSTVDSTLYECKSITPLILEEVCASECVQAGGIFVDRAAETLIRDKLVSSRYGSDEYVAAIVQAFEKKAKRTFDGSQTSNILTFGRAADNDRLNGIIKGKLVLSKGEVSETFEDVILRTVNSVLKLLRGRKIQHMLLVGGFGESPFLRARLIDIFGDQGTDVVTVEEPSKKAAALVYQSPIRTPQKRLRYRPFSEGATIWFIKQMVKARAARYTYGLQVNAHYKHNIHYERYQEAAVDIDGSTRISVFDPLVTKDFVLSKDWEKINNYSWTYKTLPTHLGDMSLDIFAWERSDSTLWTRGLDGRLLPGMRRLCVLTGDMSGLRQSLTISMTPQRERYYRLSFEVVMTFKRTTLQARLRWKEKGQIREGPVTVLPQSTF